MKSLKLICLCLILASLAACEGNGIDPAPTIEAPFVSLNHDGAVETAPNLPGGEYEAAARFNADEMVDFKDGKLVDVYFYIFNRPASATVKIYKGSNFDGPESLVYSAAVSSSIEANSWNQHTLSTPVVIEDDDYWIAVKFGMTNTAQIIGCDEGPAHPDGDWLYRTLEANWLTFRNVTSQEANINWNIRGVIEP
ncbi:MAG: hypothetical protein AAFN10_01645 [Bacteroidota bacterium]